MTLSQREGESLSRKGCQSFGARSGRPGVISIMELIGQGISAHCLAPPRIGSRDHRAFLRGLYSCACGSEPCELHPISRRGLALRQAQEAEHQLSDVLSPEPSVGRIRRLSGIRSRHYRLALPAFSSIRWSISLYVPPPGKSVLEYQKVFRSQ